MSRICVKHLPDYVSEDRLRDFFSQKGEVTDAKLIRTTDGKSRQFGFVGFRSELEAQQAIKFFNNTFMDTYRISCEIARKVGDPDIPRPWSKHSTNKQEQASKQEGELIDSEGSKPVSSKKGSKKTKKEDEEHDPHLEEFLQVMQPRSKSKLWGNDTLPAASAAAAERGDVKNHVKGGGKKAKKMVPELNNSDEEENSSSDSDEEENSSSDSDDADKQKKMVHDDVITDMDYFKSRVKKEWSDSEDDDSDGDSDSANDGNDQAKKSSNDMQSVNVDEDYSNEEAEDGSLEEPDSKPDESDEMKDEEEAVKTDRLFVRNLPYSTTEEELEEPFCKFGNITQVHIVVDRESKRSKGIAYVRYTDPESASRALKELDNSIFQGRLMHVMVAEQNNPSGQETNVQYQQSKTLKEKKLEERKASEASGNTRAWNTLYMRPDTVVENIARKFGVSKSDLFDKEGDGLAVRIALGETQVIAETKKALADAGVNVASLEDAAAGKTDGMKRSNHVVLVKNLPYGTTESDLASMFGKYASLEKIVLPPSKTLALVVFLVAAEARAAFKGLAYKRYKDAPLYLEWAPEDILNPNVSTLNKSDNTGVGQHDSKRFLLEDETGRLTDPDADPDRVESRSLYVKNLNFRTSDESLKKHFDNHLKTGKLLSVKVKKHLKNGKYVSMGFGFLEFDSVDTATSVCRDLQRTVLDGHALMLQVVHGKKGERVAKRVEDDKSSTKLIVRNVAFQATEKELRQLFSPFGQIKSLRLPMRLGNHRGFAFVEYVTKQEAKNALEALSSTHLYGRHLVLERAKEGESLEELRARTASQFEGLDNFSKKRKKMDVMDEGNLEFE